MGNFVIIMYMVLGFVYDIYGFCVLGIGFSDRVDQCVIRVRDCRIVCMHEGS